MIPHIVTHEGCTAVIHGRSYHVAAEDKYYSRVVAVLNGGKGEEQDLLWEFERVGHEIRKAAETTAGMEYAGGQVRYKGEPMRQYAVEKLVGFIKEELPTESLTKFLEKLANNPSYQTREDLYSFLEHGRMPITVRGNFLAYKAVRKDWRDIHSSSYDNSIGITNVMPRSSVDDCRQTTCSAGFHVCSYDYLPSFSHADGHVVVCEIDPADVVSIPADYDNTKMRVCRYTVIGEVEGYYANVGKEAADVLASEEVFNDEEYIVWGRRQQDVDWTWISDANDLEEAKELANDRTTGWPEVKVTTGMGIVVYRVSARSFG